eukprot:2102057-Rhodomonas_salina.1
MVWHNFFHLIFNPWHLQELSQKPNGSASEMKQEEGSSRDDASLLSRGAHEPYTDSNGACLILYNSSVVKLVKPSTLVQPKPFHDTARTTVTVTT